MIPQLLLIVSRNFIKALHLANSLIQVKMLKVIAIFNWLKLPNMSTVWLKASLHGQASLKILIKFSPASIAILSTALMLKKDALHNTRLSNFLTSLKAHPLLQVPLSTLFTNISWTLMTLRFRLITSSQAVKPATTLVTPYHSLWRKYSTQQLTSKSELTKSPTTTVERTKLQAESCLNF